jgi:hypothetical protein
VAKCVKKDDDDNADEDVILPGFFSGKNKIFLHIFLLLYAD